MSENLGGIIEELENICYNNEYILDLLGKLKNMIPVRPLPCVRDEHGAIKEQAVKRLFAKINEELDELKDACGFVRERNFDTVGEFRECQFNRRFDCIEIFQHIADEAADTITAITTMLEALGIDAEMRDEAQRRVNSRNKERGACNGR